MLPGVDKKMLDQVDAEEKCKAHGSYRSDNPVNDDGGTQKTVNYRRKQKNKNCKGKRHTRSGRNQLLKQFAQMQKMMKQLSGARQQDA